MNDTVRAILLFVLLAASSALIWRGAQRFIIRIPSTSATPQKSSLHIVTYVVGLVIISVIGFLVAAVIAISMIAGSDSSPYTPTEALVTFFVILIALAFGLGKLAMTIFKH